MAEFFKEIVDIHKQSFDPNNIRDLVDTYLLEIQMAKKDDRFEELFEGKDPGELSYPYLNTLWTQMSTRTNITCQSFKLLTYFIHFTMQIVKFTKYWEICTVLEWRQ